jgi:hypothetical protein
MVLGHYNKYRELLPFHIERANTLFLGRSHDTILRLLLDDIHGGEPVVFLSPDDSVLDYIPKKRVKDVLLFSPAQFPIHFNLLANVPEHRRALFASTILEAVKGIWRYENIATPTLDQYLRASLLTILETGGTILSVKQLLTDSAFRDFSKRHLKDNVLKDFWDDFEQMSDKEQRQDTASTLSKLRAIIFEPHLRKCLDVPNNKLHFKDKIVLLSFREQDLGKENASIMGALALAQLYIESLEGLKTTLYIEGAHQFGNAILSSVLSTVPTFLSIRFLDQFHKDFQPALIGGIEQMVAFKTSTRDAKLLAPEFDLRDVPNLSELRPGRAYHTREGVTTEIHALEHDYPKTDAREKIYERCRR